VRVIGGRYETVERIGGGGMADVFRAHDRTLDRDVAVKVMRPAFADDREFVERFHREAEALGSIDHPNIVRVLDYGANPEDRCAISFAAAAVSIKPRPPRSLPGSPKVWRRPTSAACCTAT
jgi:serine/threonine-protein kinase